MDFEPDNHTANASNDIIYRFSVAVVLYYKVYIDLMHSCIVLASCGITIIPSLDY